MSFAQDSPTRGLVDTTRLHANRAVLKKIDAADAVLTAEEVQMCQQLCRGHLLAVNGNRIAVLELDFHILGLVGSLFRRLG